MNYFTISKLYLQKKSWEEREFIHTANIYQAFG